MLPLLRRLSSRMCLVGKPSKDYSASLTPAQRSQVEKALQEWVDAKSYRLPDATVSQSAARMGMDSLMINRYFAEKGIDFRSWRSQLRLQDAQKELLASPDAPVSMIARRVGFTDRSNFNRQFKALTGVTPEVWRKTTTR